MSKFKSRFLSRTCPQTGQGHWTSYPQLGPSPMSGPRPVPEVWDWSLDKNPIHSRLSQNFKIVPVCPKSVPGPRDGCPWSQWTPRDIFSTLAKFEIFLSPSPIHSRLSRKFKFCPKSVPGTTNQSLVPGMDVPSHSGHQGTFGPLWQTLKFF